MKEDGPAVPAVVQRVADSCASQGGTAYLVGGGVRDHLRGKPVDDWDLEVFGLSARTLQKLLRQIGQVNLVGKSFGVFKLTVDGHELDVSIPRRDSKVGPGHTGIAVEGDPDMSLIDAARRRDLTLNAISFDLREHIFLDPFCGRADLASRLLRAVDKETFLEDPLRALRVVQFTARLGYSPVPELIELCKRAHLGELPAERIQAEWAKFLLKGDHLVLGMAVAHDIDGISRVFPEVTSGPASGDVLQRLITARDDDRCAGARWSLMLAAWLWQESPDAVLATLDRLWLHKVDRYDVRRQVVGLVAHATDPVDSDADLRRLSTHCEVGLALHIRVAWGDRRAHLALKRAGELGILQEAPLALLQGRDLGPLGVKPGPVMGHVLRRVYKAQIDGSVVDRPGALVAAALLISEIE